VVYANQLAARLVRLPDTAQLIGRNIMDFVHPDHRAHVVERLGRHEKGEDLLEFIEERFVLDDGAIIDVELTSRKIQFRAKTRSLSPAGTSLTAR
jgi:PAS domain S-box-containing protein